MEMIMADFQGRSYPILIKADFLEAPLPEEITSTLKDSRWVLISDHNVACEQLSLFELINERSCLNIVISPGEQSKTIQQAEHILETMAENNINRYDGIIALGGGVVGDLAGFCASVYMRGIDWVQIPTTLLSQVDSSVGGKTGINLKAGKNLAGSFYQPKAVWIDPLVLNTLAENEFWGGFAEVVKYAIIKGGNFGKWIEDNWSNILSRQPETMTRLIKKCIECKNDIVMADEREKGLRKVLNVGHTTAHAIEKLSHFQIGHGEAVRQGMLFELELASRINWLGLERCNRYKELVRKIPAAEEEDIFPLSDLIREMKKDKKNREEKISFVLPKEGNGIEEILLLPEEIYEIMI